MKNLSTLFIASILFAPLAGCTGDDSGTDTGNDAGTGMTAGDDGVDTVADDDGVDTVADDDGVDSGTAGDDGVDSGTAGDTGGPDVTVCQYQCAADGDCTIMGMDSGFTCGNNSTCVNTCAGDIDCQLFGFTPCTTNMECEMAFMGVCIDFGGDNYCANPEGDPPADCAALMQTAIEVNDVDGNAVTVCSSTPDATCGDVNGDMTCIYPAVEFTCADLMCPDPLTCDDASPSCNCAETADCEAASLPGECIEGFCIDTCAGDGDCEGLMPSFDGGGFVCL